MTRDNLKEKGLSDEQIDFIMSENGKDIEKVKAKYSDYDEIKTSLGKANETIESFKDYDVVKADVEKYKSEIAKLQEESQQQIKKLECEQKIKDFTSAKKFVNDYTRDSINSAIYDELMKEDSKGKSIEELFNSITKDKTNIFVEENKPTAPTVPSMTTSPSGDTSKINQARAVMGLPPQKD